MRFRIGCFLAIATFLLGVTETQAVEKESLASIEADTVRAAAEALTPRVVQLRYFGVEEAGVPTTGLLFDAEGWIITSSFGLERAPTNVLVRLHDGGQLSAKLIARDHPRGLALLRAEGGYEGLAPLIASDARVGQRTIALGRALRDDRVTITTGIVSAVKRLSGRAVQTDAAISPANYGGPLVALDGGLLGVLTPLAPAGQSGTDWYDSGIGFAVPLSEIEPRLPALKSGQDIRSGWLGIALEETSPLWSAPVIAEVAEKGPAKAAGIRPGDQILSLNEQACPNAFAFRRLLNGLDSGQTCRLRWDREGKSIEAGIELSDPPSNP